MARDEQLRPFAPMRALPGGDAAVREDAEDRGLWALLDSRLRGRWLVAGAVGALLAVALGAAGYFGTKPKYESVGLIRIAPYLAPTLTTTPETGHLPMYHAYVETQVSLIRSRPVLEEALRDPVMNDVAWARQPDALTRLERGLEVGPLRGSELVRISFRSDFGRESQAAVNSVINAYEKEHASGSSSQTGQNLQKLYEASNRLKAQLREKNRQIDEFIARSPLAVTELTQIIATKMGQMQEIELQIEDVLRHQRALGAGIEPGTDGATAAAGVPTLEELQALDPQLEELLRAREVATGQFAAVARTYGAGAWQYRRAAEKLRIAQEGLADAMERARETWERSVSRQRGAEPLPGGPRRSALEAELKRLQQLRQKEQDDVQRLSQDRQRLLTMQAEVAGFERELDAIETRINSLLMEADKRRITVVDRGNRPTSPSRDRRHKVAALGLVAGMGLSFGFFFLLGSIDRRAYSSVQLRDERHGSRCLGVLPDLTRSRLDPEACAVAAHCVHQIRNQIEAQRDPRSPVVVAVTSPYQGDGKTSIVMALGWSYAVAGNRTIVVDCDLVGQALTRQMGLAGRPGLREALRESRLDGLPVQAGVANLSVLPVGEDAMFGSEVVRRTDLEAIFARLRAFFDVVVVDTGPMGSLEELPVAAAADGVLLSVRRGRRQPRLEECVEALRRVGARCLGVVLNCAVRSDCERYVSRSTISVAAGESNGQQQHFGRGAAAALVQAMEAARRPEK
jgi:Mrp family chromosome partitioning ATPase/uncharacterized protein involved in exopolysaccharide biosynthesis